MYGQIGSHLNGGENIPGLEHDHVNLPIGREESFSKEDSLRDSGKWSFDPWISFQVISFPIENMNVLQQNLTI